MPTKRITPKERDAVLTTTRELIRTQIAMLAEVDKVLAACLSDAVITYDET